VPVNRMSLKVNLEGIEDSIWKPGSPLINDPKYGLSKLPPIKKMAIINKFTEYLAYKMRDLLIKRIKTQYSYLRWEPLTEGYKKYKEKVGLSPNIWEATSLLVDSITYYKHDNYYVIGIPPNIKYPNSNVHVLYVAKCMEFGTKYMPARPLFGPTIRFMRRNVRKYWELFLIDAMSGGVKR